GVGDSEERPHRSHPSRRCPRTRHPGRTGTRHVIIDNVENASAYPLGPRFQLGFDYLRSGRAETDALGRHDLDGDNVYALVQEYETKPLERGKWEAHVKHA